jgi:hypothetical protein
MSNRKPTAAWCAWWGGCGPTARGAKSRPLRIRTERSTRVVARTSLSSASLPPRSRSPAARASPRRRRKYFPGDTEGAEPVWNRKAQEHAAAAAAMDSAAARENAARGARGRRLRPGSGRRPTRHAPRGRLSRRASARSSSGRRAHASSAHSSRTSWKPPDSGAVCLKPRLLPRSVSRRLPSGRAVWCNRGNARAIFPRPRAAHLRRVTARRRPDGARRSSGRRPTGWRRGEPRRAPTVTPSW